MYIKKIKSRKTLSLVAKDRQLGSSMVEFVIVTPMLMFMGLGIMQFGLVYHAKSVLNYATFEAARAGAVNNGQIEVMRKELGYRLAPVYGGDGSLTRGAMSLGRSMVAVNDITATKIKILNPTSDSFRSHGIAKTVNDRHGDSHNTVVIPNSHLRFNNEGAKDDGLTVKDANLLKIEVTYGYQMRLPVLDMKIPGVTWIMRNLMLHADQDNWMYYTRGMLPLKSTATVRMQSEAWEYQESPPVVRALEAAYRWVKDQILAGDGDTPVGCATGTDGYASTPNTTSGIDNNAQVETIDPTDNCAKTLDIIDPNEKGC